MDYLDMLKDLADTDEDVEAQEAKSILNGARDRLNELESKVQERLSADVEAGGGATPGRKPKSEYSRAERAEKYQEWREEGKDPNEEWAKLPE